MDFDADFAVGSELEMLARESEKIFDLLRGKIRGRAATPMELHYGAIFRNAGADAFRLVLQHIEIRWRDTLVFLNHHVAGAEQAEAFAEGNMHVQRNGRLRVFRLGEDIFQVGRAKAVAPNGRGGVAGVAWTGAIVFCEKFFSDAELIAHLLNR